MVQNNNRNLIQSTFAYVVHRTILDDTGEPCDYEFLSVHPAFAKLTGLNVADILNRKVSEVLPDFTKNGFDWIAIYGGIAPGGEKMIEHYFEPLMRWFKIYVHSTDEHYLNLFIEDITHRKNTETTLRKSEEQFKSLVSHFPGIVYRCNTIMTGR
ncbi:MAG: hypothetical protein WD035_01845 [Balneolaceae bacterium]